MRLLTALIAAMMTALALAAPASANSRIKDLVDIEGVRENILVGYGLVVGLDGTGDSLRNASFTNQSLNALLAEFDVNTREANLNTRNVAAVMVTANLPAFAAPGSRIDVTISAMGDASSLQGGTLIATTLKDGQGRVWAVAQGTLTVGGFEAGGDAATITRGVPTNGRISSGAIVEQATDRNGQPIQRWDIANQPAIDLALRNPDFTTARRMADAINSFMGEHSASAVDPGTVVLMRPLSFDGNMIDLLAEVEQIRIEPDLPAKVIIDENTGTIVMGENVRVSTVAIAQGNLTITVSESPIASQPAPFSGGETVVLPRTDVTVEEDNMQLGVLEGSVSLAQLVDGLNAMGVSPRDMITILQAIKAAGALQAEIEVL